MNHSSNESLSKLELKNDFISDFAKNKLVEVVRVTNEQLSDWLYCTHDNNQSESCYQTSSVVTAGAFDLPVF